MTTARLRCVSSAALALMLGLTACDRDQGTPPASQPASSSSSSTGEPATTRPMSESVAPPTTEPQAMAPTTAPTTQPQALASPANPAAGQPQDQIQQILSYIQQNRLDLAQRALEPLDSMRNTLSPTLQRQLDLAHSSLNAARARQAFQAIPGAPSADEGQ